jgi:hypothetical protein
MLESAQQLRLMEEIERAVSVDEHMTSISRSKTQTQKDPHVSKRSLQFPLRAPKPSVSSVDRYDMSYRGKVPPRATERARSPPSRLPSARDEGTYTTTVESLNSKVRFLEEKILIMEAKGGVVGNSLLNNDSLEAQFQELKLQVSRLQERELEAKDKYRYYLICCMDKNFH